MRYAVRPFVRRAMLALFVATGSLAALSQIGCGAPHEPAKLDSAAYDEKVKEQADIRAMERASSSK